MRTVEWVWGCQWAGDTLAGVALSAFPSRHPCWGLSSLHRCVNWAGLSNYPCLWGILLPTTCDLCSSPFTLEGRWPLGTCHSHFGGVRSHGLTIPFALPLHGRGVPLFPCLECHWAQVWHSREIHPEGVEYSRKSPCIICVVDFCSLAVCPHLAVIVSLFSLRKLPCA